MKKNKKKDLSKSRYEYGTCAHLFAEGRFKVRKHKKTGNIFMLEGGKWGTKRLFVLYADSFKPTKK